MRLIDIKNYIRDYMGIVFVIYSFLVTQSFFVELSFFSNTLNRKILFLSYIPIIFLGIISFYKSKKIILNYVNAVLIMIFSLNPFYILPMIAMLPLLFMKYFSKNFKIVNITLYFIILFLKIVLVIVFFLIFFQWSSGFTHTVFDEVYSPNKQYKLVATEVDQGALGGEVVIDLYKIKSNMEEENIKRIYHGEWGERPEIIWIDNEIVEINGRRLHIFNDPTWNNY